MKKTIFFTALAAALLGGLWLTRGLGIVHIRPILCFANCAPVQASSVTWAIIGAVVLAGGSAAMFWSAKRRSV